MQKCHKDTLIWGLFVLFLHLSEITQHGMMAMCLSFHIGTLYFEMGGSPMPLGFILAGITDTP